MSEQRRRKNAPPLPASHQSTSRFSCQIQATPAAGAALQAAQNALAIVDKAADPVSARKQSILPPGLQATLAAEAVLEAAQTALANADKAADAKLSQAAAAMGKGAASFTSEFANTALALYDKKARPASLIIVGNRSFVGTLTGGSRKTSASVFATMRRRHAPGSPTAQFTCSLDVSLPCEPCGWRSRRPGLAFEPLVTASAQRPK